MSCTVWTVHPVCEALCFERCSINEAIILLLWRRKSNQHLKQVQACLHASIVSHDQKSWNPCLICKWFPRDEIKKTVCQIYGTFSFSGQIWAGKTTTKNLKIRLRGEMNIFKRFQFNCKFAELITGRTGLFSEQPWGSWKTTDDVFLSAATRCYCELSQISLPEPDLSALQ